MNGTIAKPGEHVTTAVVRRFWRKVGARPVRRSLARLGLGLVTGVGLGAPSVAAAAELAATGPAACPDGSELRFRVERAIGTSLERAAPLRFRVAFEPAAALYRARLSVLDAPASAGSERVIGPSSCAELADAVSVAIALALGSAPATPESGHVPSPLPSPPPPEEAVELSDAAAPQAPAHTDDAPLTPALAVSLLGDAGSLPGVGLGLGLGAELHAARFSVRASGTLLLDRHVSLTGPDGTAPGADLSLALGSLSACTSPLGRGAAAPFVCAGWELGRLEAAGTGVRVPRRGGAWWSAPRVDVGLALALTDSPVRLLGQLTAATPLERDYFYLQDLGTVHRPPVVVARLAFGAAVRFE